MLESICPTFVIPATLSCIIIRIYDIHMPWFSLPTTTTTFYSNPPLLPPLLVPKGSLARSNASEGYPFEKVKSRCEGATRLILSLYRAVFFSFYSAACISQLDHEPRKKTEKKKIKGRRKGLKNVQSTTSFFYLLKCYCSRALMDSLMEHLSLQVL